MQASWLVVVATAALGVAGCSGGGGGLANNDLPVRCLDEPEPGACRAPVQRYFYDYRYDRCRPFRYGGCGGRVPFETLDACEDVCVGGGR